MEGQLLQRDALAQKQLRVLAGAGPERRRFAASHQLTIIEQREAFPEIAAGLQKTVDALRLAHKDYRDLLFGGKSQLTLKERRKAAAITRARLTSALHSLASLITAF